ncbi:MAG: hypothetical protein ACK504_07360 [Bacteroidota bacterium]
MILAFIYFILFFFAVKKLSFFKDEQLTFNFLFALLIFKVFGCFLYYWIYFSYYPGSFKSDSTSTMHDAYIVYSALPNHPIDYLKIIFGIHSNGELDSLYQTYFKQIEKWGNSNSVSDFFLNDNRTSIRLHAFIMLFSFGKYAVHAFVMLALSFIGQFAFYKTFKSFFYKKEILFAIIIFLTPSVLFWSSGVLKEPLAIFLVGIFVYTFFQIFIHKHINAKIVLAFLGSILFFAVLKPYIIVLFIIPLILFTVVKRFEIRKITLFYITSIVLLYGLSSVALKFLFHRDVLHTIVNRQNDFVNLSKGGIFLTNTHKYVRLDINDKKSILMLDSIQSTCRIKPHTKLMYWDEKNLNNLRDTIFDFDNKDSSLYHLISIIPPAGSAIKINRLEYNLQSFVTLIPQSLFNVLCRPFFYDSHSITEFMASLENLFILIFFIYCFLNSKIKREHINFLIFLMSIVFLSYLLIGLTTTVTGAIVRYKVPFFPLLLMIPLLLLDADKIKRFQFLRKK